MILKTSELEHDFATWTSFFKILDLDRDNLTVELRAEIPRKQKTKLLTENGLPLVQ